MSCEIWSAVKDPGCPGRAVVAVRFNCVDVGREIDTRELELKDTYSIPDLPTYTPKILPPRPATGEPLPFVRPVWNAGGYIVTILTSLPP